MKQRSPERPTRVLVTRAEYDGSLADAVQAILEAFPRDWRGRSVLVKPNMLAPHPPEKAVTTHPELVRAVVRALQERGADVLVGDNPGVGGYGRSRRSAQECGLLDAAGDCFVNLGRSPVHVPLATGRLSGVTVSREVLQADLVVSLPKLKTHSLTVLTAAIKNTFGYVVGGDKMSVHAKCPNPRSFAEALVDVFSLRPPDLSILDAVQAMQGNGPANGQPVPLGRIMASDDAVGLDAAALHLLGQPVRAVPHVEIAGRRGLGETDLSRMEILGRLSPVSGFRFPKTFVPGLAGLVLNRYLSRWINCIPEIVQERCVSCGLCASHCPAGALRMTESGPVLTPGECIHCYCCQEMCPEDAINLSGRVLNFLRRG